jgi:hypothetical protein
MPLYVIATQSKADDRLGIVYCGATVHLPAQKVERKSA